MKQKKKEMIEGYIHDLEDAIWKFDRGASVGMVFDLVDEIIGVFSQEIPGIGNGIVLRLDLQEPMQRLYSNGFPCI